MGDNNAEDLLKLVTDNFLNQVIREPTISITIFNTNLDLVKEADVGAVR